MGHPERHAERCEISDGRRAASDATMTAQSLYQAGRLNDAIDALSAELRSNPTDTQRRTFLFELLCFAGNYDRAAMQLDILSQGGKQAAMGTLLYQSALHAERMRQTMFAENTLPLASEPATALSGTLNGKPFTSISDGDPRVGARLEVFAAGQYTLLPLAHLESVRMQPPKRLRDLLWAPAIVRTAPSFKGMELGEVLIPVMAPGSWQDEDDSIRLGRATAWIALDDGQEAPIGQRVMRVDADEVPVLEIRDLVLTPTTGGTP
jgi:type VI secretion system protein ImpE